MSSGPPWLPTRPRPRIMHLTSADPGSCQAHQAGFTAPGALLFAHQLTGPGRSRPPWRPVAARRPVPAAVPAAPSHCPSGPTPGRYRPSLLTHSGGQGTHRADSPPARPNEPKDRGAHQLAGVSGATPRPSTAPAPSPCPVMSSVCTRTRTPPRAHSPEHSGRGHSAPWTQARTPWLSTGRHPTPAPRRPSRQRERPRDRR